MHFSLFLIGLIFVLMLDTTNSIHKTNVQIGERTSACFMKSKVARKLWFLNKPSWKLGYTKVSRLKLCIQFKQFIHMTVFAGVHKQTLDSYIVCALIHICKMHEYHCDTNLLHILTCDTWLCYCHAPLKMLKVSVLGYLILKRSFMHSFQIIEHRR